MMMKYLETVFFLFCIPVFLCQSCAFPNRAEKIPPSDLFLISHCVDTQSSKPCGKKFVINNDTIVYKILQKIKQLEVVDERAFIQKNNEFIVFLIKTTNNVLKNRFLINQDSSCIWIPGRGYYHFDKTILDKHKSYMGKLEIWNVKFKQKSMAINFLKNVRGQYYIPTNYFIVNSVQKPALLWEYFEGYYVYEIPQKKHQQFIHTDIPLKKIKKFFIQKGLEGHVQMVDLNRDNGMLKGKIYAPKQELNESLKKWLNYKKIKEYNIKIFDIKKQKLKNILYDLKMPSSAYIINSMDK